MVNGNKTIFIFIIINKSDMIFDKTHIIIQCVISKFNLDN